MKSSSLLRLIASLAVVSALGCGTVTAPSCSDGVKNATETDVDCGGGECQACLIGQHCSSVTDCGSLATCAAGVCVPMNSAGGGTAATGGGTTATGGGTTATGGGTSATGGGASATGGGTAATGGGAAATGGGTAETGGGTAETGGGTAATGGGTAATGGGTTATGGGTAATGGGTTATGGGTTATGGGTAATGGGTTATGGGTAATGGGTAATGGGTAATGGGTAATGGGTAATGGGTTSTGGGATGGGCQAPADCPGTDTLCQTRTCNNHQCGVNNVAAGTAVGTQIAGDCHQNQCDGNGAQVNAIFNADVPDDGNQCTANICTNGTPSNPASAPGDTCAQGGGTLCNGSGTCVQCLVATTCPGSDTECKTRTCTTGTCGFANAPEGKVTSAQTAGDCHRNQCDASGNIVSAVFNGDVPNDNVECTYDICTNGVPSNPPVPANTACVSGGKYCDGAGACVQCNLASQCAGTDTECSARTCTTHTCGFAPKPPGTPTSAQVAGDCHRNECDGASNIVNNIYDFDYPVDSNQCTDDQCFLGLPSNLPSAPGTVCSQNGGLKCDGNSVCSDLAYVVRVGDGSGALTSASTTVMLDRRFVTTGALDGTVNLPVAASGSNAPLTLSGTASTEGALNRSTDGKFLILTGYATAPGLAAVPTTTAAAVNRVVGTISATDVIDTSTKLSTVFDGVAARSAASVDGTNFWVCGAGSGLQYVAVGSSAATQLMSSPSNLRVLSIVNGQLYASSSATGTGIGTIGTGLPVTAGQTFTSLFSLTDTASPNSYVFLDVSPSVPGIDTLYVADDNSTTKGIIKFTFNGLVWVKAATLTGGLTSGFRGITGWVANSKVYLWATSSDSSSNKLVQIIDDGSGSPTANLLSTAPANVVYRGVSLAPR